MLQATTFQTGVALRACTAAPREATTAIVNTLVAIATRGGTRQRTTSWVVEISGSPALIIPVRTPPTAAMATPGGRQQVGYS